MPNTDEQPEAWFDCFGKRKQALLEQDLFESHHLVRILNLKVYITSKRILISLSFI